MKRSLGMTVLAIYLIVAGILPFLNLPYGFIHYLVPILAIVAGVLLLIGK